MTWPELQLNTKEIFKNLIKKHEDIGFKYVFLIDANSFIEYLITDESFAVLIDDTKARNEDTSFTTEEFIESAVSPGKILSCNRELFYIPICFSAKRNRNLQDLLVENGFNVSKDAWKAFSSNKIDHYKNNIEVFKEKVQEVLKNCNGEEENANTNFTEVEEREFNYVRFSSKFEEKAISNFIIKPIALTSSEDSAVFTLDFHTKNKVIRKTIPTHCFSSAVKFKFELNRNSTELFYKGSDSELEDIKYFFTQNEFPTIRGVRQIGIHKTNDELCFVSSEKAINAKAKELDSISILKNFESIKTSILDFENLNKEEALELKNHIFNFSEISKTLIILGFCSSCFFKEHLYENKVKLNHLQLVGEAGSGKSTTLSNIIQPIFSIDSQAANASGLTKFTALKTCSSSNLMPFIIDEYKPAKLTLFLLNLMSEIMRNTYDRNISYRGRADGSVSEFRSDSPIVLAGEAGFDEMATFERSLILTYAKSELTKESSESMDFLKINKQMLNKLGHSLLMLALNSDSRGIFEDFKVWSSKTCKEIKSSRIADSVAVCMVGLNQLFKIFENLGTNLNLNLEEAFQLILKNLNEDMLEESTSTKTSVERLIEIIDTMAEKEILSKDIDYILLEAENEIRLDIKNIYPEITKFIKNHAIGDVELLSQNEFTKQLRKTEFFKKYTPIRFKRARTVVKNAYVLDSNKLNAKLSLNVFNFENKEEDLNPFL